jgi:hypothetical protein
LNPLRIEDMSYLGEGFSFYNGTKHHSQFEGKRTKVKLLFFVNVTEEEYAADPGAPFKIAAIRVPRGLPIYRIRYFIKFMETELAKIYGQAKRLNVVLLADEDSSEWRHEALLPMYSIFYA